MHQNRSFIQIKVTTQSFPVKCFIFCHLSYSLPSGGCDYCLKNRYHYKDLKVHIEIQKPFQIIREAKSEFNKTKTILEPQKTPSKQEKEALLPSTNPTMGTIVDDVRTIIQDEKYVFVPVLNDLEI